MATFRRVGTINRFQARFIDGMVANGYQRDFAERCFKQIEGFGDYGFPESHATSFALLVYVSSWLKCHHPAVFACALLNSQPMGFYAPAQIVRDARDHGVQVLPVDVNASDWDCTLEPCVDHGRPAPPPSHAYMVPSGWLGGGAGRHGNHQESGGVGRRSDGKKKPCTRYLALRLGFRQVKGLKQEEMERLVARRGHGYGDLAELRRRAELRAGALDHLARADGFGSMQLDRRGAIWSAIGLDRTGHELDPPPLFAWAEQRTAKPEPEIELPAMTLGQHVVEDYANLKLTLRCHPLALLRPWLDRRVVKAERLAVIETDRWVEVAGLVLVRQRPGTASGVIFVTLEDETGIANLVVWPKVFERHRRVVLGAQMMAVRGKLQREGLVIHVIADALFDRTDLLHRLSDARSDRLKRGSGAGGRPSAARRKSSKPAASEPPFAAPVARADEVEHPHHDPRLDGFTSRNFH